MKRVKVVNDANDVIEIWQDQIEQYKKLGFTNKSKSTTKTKENKKWQHTQEAQD